MLINTLRKLEVVSALFSIYVPTFSLMKWNNLQLLI